MSKKETFAATVAASAEAQAHAQEIQQTRVGGLGGSDAAIVLKIGLRGLSALTATDLKRLCIMTGKMPVETFAGNAHTNAGHAFEDYAESHLPWGIAVNTPKPYEREKVLEQKLADNFKTFAHADFAAGKNRLQIIECKFVQKPTDKVAQEYYAQLQWYYLLGAQSVHLYHATGKAEPFEVEEATLQPIERDEETIKALLNGVKILDEALTDGWEPILPDKMDIDDAPTMVQTAFETLAQIKAKEAELKTQKEQATAVLKSFVEDFGLTGLTSSGETKHQVIYSRATPTKTFDAAKFLADHPEYNDRPEYWKTGTRAASITFK
jgi:hypothetical protein